MSASKNKRKTALIIHPSPDTTRLIRAVLQGIGFRDIRHVASGAEAFQFLGIGNQKTADSPAPRIVMISQPGSAGFEIGKKIKNAFNREIGILLSVSMDVEDLHQQCLDAGIDDFLLEPLDPVELATRVKLLLKRLEREEKIAATEKEQILAVSSSAVANQTLPAVGEQIDGYEIQELITWSGMSLIYRVRNVQNNEQNVIKLLTPQATEYPDVIVRFRRECEVLADLSHPNIIQLRDHGEFEQLPYVVLEYVDGKTLEQVVEESAPLPFDLIFRVAESLAHALQHAHRKNVIHRDIKLKNIFLAKSGEVKLGDFGIALKQGEHRLTQTGYSLGTPMYMSPEQFHDNFTGPASDIYSLGVSLYHLISGVLPFQAVNTADLMHQHSALTPDSLTELRSDVPPEWNAFIVDCCLAKDIDQRPQDMTEVLAQLDLLRLHPFAPHS